MHIIILVLTYKTQNVELKFISCDFFSVKGSYLAACMHFLAIFGDGTSVVGNVYHGGLDSATALQLQVITTKLLLRQFAMEVHF